MPGKVLIVGISGVTCGGKTTLANELHRILPNSQLLSQDAYFYPVDDPRHLWLPDLNHINFDIVSSIDMEKLTNDIYQLINTKQLIESTDQNRQSQNVNDLDVLQEAILNVDLDIIIVEGFCIFNYKPLQPLFHLKYYFTLPKEECRLRRNRRVYEPPDCPGYFDKCAWPEHLKSLKEVQTELRGVTYFDEHTADNALEYVLAEIATAINSCEL